MTDLLPKINTTQYEVSDNTWHELSTEIQRVTALINDGAELEPNDVKNVRSLASAVRDYGVSYRQSISKAATNYKSLLDKELDRLGYGVIEKYVDDKRKEQNNAINDRLNAKLAKFNDIVTSEVDKTQYLKTSPIANYVANNLASRFPKLNSGAVSKEIAKWAPIESVIHMSVTAADKVFIDNPVLNQLPATSQSLRAVSQYLETGDVHAIDNIHDLLVADKPLLQRMVIQKTVKTSDDTIEQINNVMASNVDSDTKLEQIKMLIDIHNTTY